MASTGTTYDTDCKLMLHMDGTDASTSFPDASDSAQTATANGNAQVDTAQFKFGQSGLFDGTNDFLEITGTLSDFTFGTGDFTIDFWARFAASNTNVVPFDGDSGAKFSILFSDVDTVVFYLQGDSNNIFPFVRSADTWYHIAFVRSASVLHLFRDGTEVTPSFLGDDHADMTEPAVVRIGTRADGAFDYAGHIDEFRVVKGTPVWTANFTPPTAAYTEAGVGGSLIINRFMF